MKEHLISLEERAALNTSPPSPLYFACTQLRDNLAIYQDVIGAEQSQTFAAAASAAESAATRHMVGTEA